MRAATFSQRKRKRVEEVFGCGNVVGPFGKARGREVPRVGAMFALGEEPEHGENPKYREKTAPDQRRLCLCE